MMKAVWSTITTATAVVLLSGFSVTSAYAQATAPGTLNVSVTIAAKAKLTLGVASISFADADPDTTPTLTSAGVPVDVKARASASGNVTLTVLASGDLVSGTSTIGIGSLTWTTLGAGFVAGTANRTTAQAVGSWTGSGNPTGMQVFTLPNSWTYSTGTYSVTLNYTLTAP